MTPDERWEPWLREVIKGRHLKEPSRAALAHAISLGRGLHKPDAGWLVELIFDSFSQPLPVGVRSPGVSERRLLYRVESQPGAAALHELDLRVRRESAGKLELIGQLLPPPGPGRVEAWAGRRRTSQALESSGEFLLRGLPGGTGTLQLEFQTEAGEVLVVRNIPLLPPEGDSVS